MDNLAKTDVVGPSPETDRDGETREDETTDRSTSPRLRVTGPHLELSSVHKTDEDVPLRLHHVVFNFDKKEKKGVKRWRGRERENDN